MRIEGREIAQKILDDLKNKVQKSNVIPHLAIILVGNDPASIAYIEQKDLKAEEIGAKITMINLDSNVDSSRLKEVIEKLNADISIHGIIVQRPLPIQINTQAISSAIDPKKDVDGFHPQSKFQPPIALAILEILKSEDLKNKNIVVVGKGEAGGQPIIQMFKKMNINPTIIDRATENPKELMKKADIIISAVGKSNVVNSDMIKKGVILISVGLHKGSEGKLHGDYNEEGIKEIASFYTPTPGGVGPVNVAMLLSNLVDSFEALS